MKKFIIICSVFIITTNAYPSYQYQSGTQGQRFQEGNFQNSHTTRRNENFGGYSGVTNRPAGNYNPAGSNLPNGNYQHDLGLIRGQPNNYPGAGNVGGYPNTGGTFQQGGLAGSQGNIGGYPNGGYKTHGY